MTAVEKKKQELLEITTSDEYTTHYTRTTRKLAKDLLVCIETLESIAANSCCNQCQEAKLVAQKTLAKIAREDK